MQLPTVLGFLGVALGVASTGLGAIPEKIGFNEHIRPILSNNCFACHGTDPKKREADLRLDTLEGATADQDGVKAIVPGDLTSSELWRRITSTDENEVMPPPDSHKTLTNDEKTILKAWIEQGAPYQKHWAFEPIASPAPPEVKDARLPVRNPIDAFVAARLQADGLSLAPEADKPTLIRRVAFSLTGLPPTPAELDEYLKDESADAYEKMVDRYLASPRYGEEMARHWLDVARYADTHGLHLDNERQMWAYRDWVINAFNINQPFDRFTVEQIAGDLLPGATTDQLVATGFNRCNVTTSEGGSIDSEFVFRYAVERASTTAEAWMGLTAGCAVCHDHKFDPISQKEFYSLYAFFHSAADPPMDGNALLTAPTMKLDTPEVKAKLQTYDTQIADLQRQLNERAANLKYDDPASVQPPPQPAILETVWLEDEFPAGANVQPGGNNTTFVTAEQGGQVFSGVRALKRSGGGLSQDFYNSGAAPLMMPAEPKLFANVYLDPQNPPKSIMIQFHKGGWNRRLVWGEYGAIGFGAANTFEKVNMGPLPALGQWVRLEVPAEKVNLSAGDQLEGFALTQFDGTVYWDKVGVAGRSDAAADPRKSFQAWWTAVKGKDTPGLAGDLNAIAKHGPSAEVLPEVQKRLLDFYVRTICEVTRPEFDTLNGELKKITDARAAAESAIPGTFIFKDLPTPRESFVMERGAYDKPGEKVEPGVLAVLPPMKKADAGARATRLDLANWLVSSEHPLTARVTVNRFWQQFFGTGLVKTSFDFGSQGEVPVNLELLDWLSSHFKNNGWDVKQLTKLILCSSAFRQSSRVTPENYAHDPENRLCARGPRFRLDAEQIRDNALFVSGLINLEMGGKGVKPYQPNNIWEPLGFVGSNTREYQQDMGPAVYRRSIYVFFKRTAPPPFMVNFDASNREQFCTRRERSNTPLQALQLMNDVQHVEAARALAERMLSEGGAGPAERIEFAYRTVLSRAPETEESTIIAEQLAAHLARYQQDVPAATKLISHGQSKPKAELNPAELAAYTLVANMILNLDETVMRN